MSHEVKPELKIKKSMSGSSLYSFFSGKKKVEASAPPLHTLPSDSRYKQCHVLYRKLTKLFIENNSSLPDPLPVASRGGPTLDEYMTLHQHATRMEEELLSFRNNGTIVNLRQEVLLRSRILKLSLGLLLMAVFIPGLFQLFLTLSIAGLFLLMSVFYYFKIQPYAAKLDEVFHHIGELLGSLNSEAVHQARKRLNHEANRRLK